MSKLFVGRLSGHVSERDVEDLFAKYGPVDRIHFKKTFAFVHYLNEKDAAEAVRHLDGYRLDGPDGITVEYAKDTGKSVSNNMYGPSSSSAIPRRSESPPHVPRPGRYERFPPNFAESYYPREDERRFIEEKHIRERDRDYRRPYEEYPPTRGGPIYNAPIRRPEPSYYPVGSSGRPYPSSSEFSSRPSYYRRDGPSRDYDRGDRLDERSGRLGPSPGYDSSWSHEEPFRHRQEFSDRRGPIGRYDSGPRSSNFRRQSPSRVRPSPSNVARPAQDKSIDFQDSAANPSGKYDEINNNSAKLNVSTDSPKVLDQNAGEILPESTSLRSTQKLMHRAARSPSPVVEYD